MCFSCGGAQRTEKNKERESVCLEKGENRFNSLLSLSLLPLLLLLLLFFLHVSVGRGQNEEEGFFSFGSCQKGSVLFCPAEGRGDKGTELTQADSRSQSPLEHYKAAAAAAAAASAAGA